MIAYVLLRVFVILLLVAANAFFAAAEFALVSVRETRIQQLIEAHRAGARTVLKLHQQLSRVVNGVQLGITVTSLTLGWLGEPVLARLFESWIGSIPTPSSTRMPSPSAVAFVHDHQPARDPGRTGSQVARVAASRARRPRRSRAHGRFPDHHRPLDLRHEPRRWLCPPRLRHARDPARLRPLARRTQAHRNRRPPLRTALPPRKRCC
jgi:hypothetical protein